MSKITTCDRSCKSEFQDAKYGKGLRLHNLGYKAGKPVGKAYCTVCCTRSSEKQEKDVTVDLYKNFGVKFMTIAPKTRLALAKKY